MSPYEEKYVDVKFIGEVSGPVTLTLDEGIVSPPSPKKWKYVQILFLTVICELWQLSLFFTVYVDFQQWRLVCLALGFTSILFAPIVSSWVPFYYSSSMAIGVLLVIIILLFQVFHPFIFLLGYVSCIYWAYCMEASLFWRFSCILCNVTPTF